MSRFDLKNFTSKEENTIDGGDHNLPEWLEKCSAKTKSIYDHIVQERSSIEAKISSGAKLKINERKIVVSRIARKAGVDKSYISERRMPQVVGFIKQTNDRLDRIWSTKDRRNKSQPKSKKEMEREISSLKKKLRLERDNKHSEIITLALKEKSSNNSASLISEIAQLKQANANHLETIAALRSKLRAMQQAGSIKEVKQ